MQFKTWLENDEQQDALHQVVQTVFGNIQPDNGVYWIPFLDKTIYAPNCVSQTTPAASPTSSWRFSIPNDLGADLPPCLSRFRQAPCL
jgi:hypothetical protein